MWEHGVQIETPFDKRMSFADATELWGLNESTLRKAVAYGKLVNGIDVCAVEIACKIIADSFEDYLRRIIDDGYDFINEDTAGK